MMNRCLFFLGVICCSWSNWQPQVRAAILINELLADPAGDANRDGSVSTTQDEFVELINTDAVQQSLAQWSLSDALRVRHVFGEADTIAGGGFFVVFGGGAPQGFTTASLASTGTLSLNNTGDTLTLRDAGGIAIDAVTYGSEGGMDVSLTRSPDGSGAFVKHSSLGQRSFSPGQTVDGLASLSIPTPHTEPPAASDTPAPFDPPAQTPPPADPVSQAFPPDPHDVTIPTAGTFADPLPNSSAPDGPVVPEPSGLWLMGVGLAGLATSRRAPRST